jgi:D-alanine--poly(phosphoribitol) ligase subunit 2
MHAQLVALIKELAREMLEAEGRAAVDMEEGTELFGKTGLLDSMGIVSLVVAVEQELESRHGITVSLADQRALSQQSGPYRTIGTMAAYAESLATAEQ